VPDPDAYERANYQVMEEGDTVAADARVIQSAAL